MRIQRLDVGLEGISRWQVDDEQHLPKDGTLAPKFLPKQGELDDILKRPSLDERLPRLLEPEFVDPDLLDPSILTQARLGALAIFRDAARQANGEQRTSLQNAADQLDQEIEFDQEIRTALAALLRG